jgi:hypothetical protein
MTITKRPTAKKADESTAMDSFINAAPDALKVSTVDARKGLMRGKREQISHTIPPALLAKIDAVAETKGMTRAGLINLAISDYLDK